MAKANEPVMIKPSANVYTGLAFAALVVVAGGLAILILRAFAVLPENGIF